jgi:hypothetical protein
MMTGRAFLLFLGLEVKILAAHLGMKDEVSFRLMMCPLVLEHQLKPEAFIIELFSSRSYILQITVQNYTGTAR